MTIIIIKSPTLTKIAAFNLLIYRIQQIKLTTQETNVAYQITTEN